MSFIAELRRRNVLRVATAYIVTGWLVVQVVETVFPAFGFDESATRVVVIALAIGLLPVVVVAWAFELTPDGLKLDRDAASDPDQTTRSGKTLDRVIMVVLALGLGYFAFDKFVLEPARDADLAERAAEQARTEALVGHYGERSVAVLPFTNISDDPEQAFFSDGVAEAILDLLARVPDLRVISRSSAFTFRGDVDISEVAEALDVAFVLGGSVRRAGDRVRIAVRLIDARTDSTVWSNTFERTLNDIFAVEDEVAALVVEKLELQLSAAPPTALRTDQEVYTLYMQARYLWNVGNTDAGARAESVVQDALAIDPNYVPAWNLLARIYGPGRLPLALGAVRKALALDPNDALANAYLGLARAIGEPDISPGLALIQKGVDAAPNNTDVLNAAAQAAKLIGRFDLAAAIEQHALRVDPLCNFCRYSLANALLLGGRYGEAEESIKRYQVTGDGGWHTLGNIHLLAGDGRAALDAYAKQELPEFNRLTGEALALYSLGQTDLHEKTFAQLVEKWGQEHPWMVARVHAWAGDADAAFAWIDKRAGLDPVTFRMEFSRLLWDPVVSSLHDDPRWAELRERAGLNADRLEAARFDPTLPARGAP